MITVLIADDHAIVRDALRYLLEGAGDIQVIDMAANGQEAVHKAGKRCPDVAVIDISMPVMDGIEASRQIRLCCPETRILMLSMHHTYEYVERCLKAGATGYVLKDSAGSDLVTAVRSVYQGQPYFSKKITDIAMRFYASRN